MFVGREKEIQIIENKIISDKFEFGILYGRRRVGKTTILKEIIKKHQGIYFVANEMGYDYNIARLFQTVATYFNEPVTFNSLEMMFEYLKNKAQKEYITLIIDEFTYLFVKEIGIQSILQNIIDEQKNSSRMTLILSGSQVGMVEDAISYHKPLYGRATFKIHLKPFNYLESSEFYKGYSNEDKIRVYSIFGGIPYYLAKIDDRLSIKENIVNLVIDEHGILAEETEFFLKQELRSVTSYSMIINAVSSGATRLSQISTKAQINNTGTTTKYLDTLKSLGIIEKEICYGEKENSKKTLYKIKDHFFNFYYRFIYIHKSRLNLMEPSAFYDTFIEPTLDEYVSFNFEHVAKQFLILLSKKNMTTHILEINRFWGNHKKLKREVEIDIVVKDEKEIFVYECKWTNDQFRLSEYKDLKLESDILLPTKIGGFSKSGFSDEASKHLDVYYTCDDMFNL